MDVDTAEEQLSNLTVVEGMDMAGNHVVEDTTAGSVPPPPQVLEPALV
jgi:hypothetical protein